MEIFAIIDIFICKLDFMNIDIHETLNYKLDNCRKSVKSFERHGIKLHDKLHEIFNYKFERK